MESIYNFSIDNFKKWCVDKQVKYINSLDDKSKFKFLEKFLPGSEFIIPPYIFLKFLKNGEIIFDFIRSQGSKENSHKEKYYICSWEIENEKLKLSNKYNDEYIPINSNEVWYKLKAVKLPGDSIDLTIEFITINSKEFPNGVSLDYERHGTGSRIFKKYEEYLKSNKGQR